MHLSVCLSYTQTWIQANINTPMSHIAWHCGLSLQQWEEQNDLAAKALLPGTLYECTSLCVLKWMNEWMNTGVSKCLCAFSVSRDGFDWNHVLSYCLVSIIVALQWWLFTVTYTEKPKIRYNRIKVEPKEEKYWGWLRTFKLPFIC